MQSLSGVRHGSFVKSAARCSQETNSLREAPNLRLSDELMAENAR